MQVGTSFQSKLKPVQSPWHVPLHGMRVSPYQLQVNWRRLFQVSVNNGGVVQTENHRVKHPLVYKTQKEAKHLLST